MYNNKMPFTIRDAFNSGFEIGMLAVFLDIPIGIACAFISEAIGYWTLGDAGMQGNERPALRGFFIGTLISVLLASRWKVRKLRRAHEFEGSRFPALIPGIITGAASGGAGIVVMIMCAIVMILGILAAPVVLSITIVIVLE